MIRVTVYSTCVCLLGFALQFLAFGCGGDDVIYEDVWEDVEETVDLVEEVVDVVDEYTEVLDGEVTEDSAETLDTVDYIEDGGSEILYDSEAEDFDVDYDDGAEVADVSDGESGPARCPEGMNYIPESTFLRGRAGSSSILGPQRVIYLDAYCIQEREVTNIEYDGCTSCVDYEYWSSHTYLPMDQALWTDADEYCRWAGFRLPTEAEWEKAARGGCELDGVVGCDSLEDSWIYPWGNRLTSCDQVRFRGCPEGSGSLDVSRYGVRAMAGGVHEWVSDWYDPDYYTYSSDRNPTGPEEDVDGRKVFRGGVDLASGDERFRIDNRYAGLVDAPAYSVGVRCAADPLW